MQGFTFPYLYDGDTQVDGQGLRLPRDAARLPFRSGAEAALRRAGRRLAFRGPEDRDVARRAQCRRRAARRQAGHDADDQVMGCSTKWNTKRDDVAKADAKWKAEPVDLALIDAAGVAKLAKNDSNRLRLVNVWATWCAPCVEEFPELVAAFAPLEQPRFRAGDDLDGRPEAAAAGEDVSRTASRVAAGATEAAARGGRARAAELPLHRREHRRARSRRSTPSGRARCRTPF